MRENKLPVANAIWIGRELGPVQTACLRSFVRAGHKTVLHCYEEPIDIPDCVGVADASHLLPHSRLVAHRQTGSYAPFSDLLRYEILHRGLGLYVDCDVFCIRPIADEDYIFGWSTRKSINNAVLRLPAGSPLLHDLCRIKSGFIPPWASPRYRLRMRLNRLLGGSTPSIEDLPWGWTGPKALTWYAKYHAVDHLAKDRAVFYPLESREMPLLLDPNRKLEDLITPRTAAVHLYNEYFRRKSLSAAPVPPSSPLGRIIAAA
jgi:hypothetical protein